MPHHERRHPPTFPYQSGQILATLPGTDVHLREICVPGHGSCFWESVVVSLNHDGRADELRSAIAGLCDATPGCTASTSRMMHDPSTWADASLIKLSMVPLGLDVIFVYKRDPDAPVSFRNLRAYCGVRGCRDATTLVLVYWRLNAGGEGQHFNAIAVEWGGKTYTSLVKGTPLARLVESHLYQCGGHRAGVLDAVLPGGRDATGCGCGSSP